jgi:hypothetical protein
MTEQGSPQARQQIDARRGFEAFVAGVNGQEVQVVDFDLAPAGPFMEFNSLQEVRVTYEDLAANLPATELNHDLLAGQLAADLMFARVLGGEEVPFTEYIEATVGLTPQVVPEEEIQAHATDMNTLLQERGMRYDEGSLGQFEETMLVASAEAIERRFKAAQAATVLLAQDVVTSPDELLEPRFESVQDAPWSAYLTTEASGEFVMGVNTHPERRYTPGKVAELALHEYGGHYMQMAAWQRAITRGGISPAAGVTAMHSPENTQLEAVAQFMEYSLPEVLPAGERWFADYHSVYRELKGAVEHNAHLMINNGTDEPTAIAYAVHRLPFESPERIASSLRVGRDNVMARACLAVYVPSLELVRPVMDLPPALRQETLRRLYAEPMTPFQIKNLVGQAVTQSALANEAASL